MSVKISELTASSAVTSNDFVPIVDYETTTTKRASASQFLDYITGSTFNNLNATTLTSSNALFVTTTSSQALITGDLRVLGTASITQLNTIGQTSLLIGDKYITILSGGVDHTGINGAGFLWGSSSGPGETTGALGEHAHILYDASRDALEIFPGLYVTGSTTLFDVSGTTAQFTTVTATNISGVIGQFTTVSGTEANISGNLLLTGESNLSQYPDYAYIIYTSSIDKLVVYPGLYVSGNLTGSGLGAFQTISASNYIGLPTSSGGTPGGTNQTIQFNSGSTFSGSTNLIFNYTNNTLSGTTAQFTVISASVISASSYVGPIGGGGGGDVTTTGNNTFTGINTFNANFITASEGITGSIAKFTTITGSSMRIEGQTVFSGSMLIYGTASLSQNPSAAYLLYSSSINKLVAYPGLYVSGNLTGSGHAKFNEISGTTAQFTVISASVISASSYLGPIVGSGGGDVTTTGSNTFTGINTFNINYITASIGITGSDAKFTTITGSSMAIEGQTVFSGSMLIYGTASLSQNPTAAYLIYSSSIDKLVAYPGLYIDGNVTGSGHAKFNEISGTTARFTQLTGNISFSASNPSYWTGTAPTNMQDALNRIAAAIYNGVTGSIA